MSADQRLTAAREYLGYVRKLTVADLPRTPLVRLAAELRRQLGQVLDIVGALDQATSTGLDEAQREVLGRALADAVWWHTDTSSCEGCIQSPSGLCERHAPEVNQRDAYIRLARELGIELESGSGAVYLEMNAELPHPPRLIGDHERVAPAGRLAAIRAVLAGVLHDEHADRQYALEEIERIAGGEDR